MSGISLASSGRATLRGAASQTRRVAAHLDLGVKAEAEPELPETRSSQTLGTMWASTAGLSFSVATDVDAVAIQVSGVSTARSTRMTMARRCGRGVGSRSTTGVRPADSTSRVVDGLTNPREVWVPAHSPG